MKSKIKNVLCDTNVIVRYLLGEDSEHGEVAISLMDDVKTGKIKILILEAVFIESVFVLSKFYQVPRLELSKAMQGLLQYRYIVNDSKLIWINALNHYAQTNLHIVDCLLLANAQHNNIELVTFDQDLNKMNTRKDK